MPLTYDKEEEELPLLENRDLTVPKPKSTIDLRDEIDEFIFWIKSQDPKTFTGKRQAVLNRIQQYKRPA